MAYIPPHLREGGSKWKMKEPLTVHEHPRTVDNGFTLDEIDAYFWPSKLSSEDQDRRTGHGTTGAGGFHGKTMHDSEKTPGKLAYVILYQGANPRWESDNIIFTKSSLSLLPRSLEDASHAETNADGLESESDAHEAEGGVNGTAGDVHAEPQQQSIPADSSRSIAVFKEKRLKGFKGNVFESWYKLERVAFLQPGSEELMRMLEQKWTRTKRNGETYTPERKGTEWERSLSLEWAVVKFEKDEVADKDRGPPAI